MKNNLSYFFNETTKKPFSSLLICLGIISCVLSVVALYFFFIQQDSNLLYLLKILFYPFLLFEILIICSIAIRFFFIVLNMHKELKQRLL
jgi:hypothetical protein